MEHLFNYRLITPEGRVRRSLYRGRAPDRHIVLQRLEAGSGGVVQAITRLPDWLERLCAHYPGRARIAPIDQQRRSGGLPE